MTTVSEAITPKQHSLRTTAGRLFLKHEWLRGYALLSPTLLVMVSAIAVPIMILLLYSFWTQQYIHIDKTLTLNNYYAFFQNDIYPALLFKSIKISALVTLMTILLAYPVAYFLAFRVKKNVMTWLVLINLPFMASYLLRVLGWKIMLGNNGIINSSLLNMGIIDQALDYLLYSPFAVTLTLVHGWSVFAILPLYLALSKIDRSLLEASADLGESPSRTFFRVTLPLSMPGIIAAAVIQFIPVVGDYVTPLLVGGPKGMMFSQIIAAQFGPANNMPLGAALTIMMMLTIAVTIGSFVWLARKATVKDSAMEVTSNSTDGNDVVRGFSWLTLFVMAYMVFLYVPALMLPLFSFNDSIQMVLPLKGFTFKWYQQISDMPGMVTALGNSLKVAAPVAIVSTILATIGARALTRYRLPGKTLVTSFILLPMILPGIILAVGLLVAALALGLPLSLWTVGIAHVVMTVPFSMLVIMARLDGLGNSLEESAGDLGENPWITFWRVTFPLILPAIAAALILSFTASFDEFLFALFLGGNDTTLPVYMYSILRFPKNLPPLLALGSCIFVGSALLFILSDRLRRLGIKE